MYDFWLSTFFGELLCVRVCLTRAWCRCARKRLVETIIFGPKPTLPTPNELINILQCYGQRPDLQLQPGDDDEFFERLVRLLLKWLHALSCCLFVDSITPLLVLGSWLNAAISISNAQPFLS